MSNKTNETNGLLNVLEQRLTKIDGARALVLSTLDGIELISVTSQLKNRRNGEDLFLINQYSSLCSITSHHASKLGFGSQKYSITWVDDGILVQSKLEAAVLSIYLEETANLGLLEEQLDILLRILHPFTTSNFIQANI